MNAILLRSSSGGEALKNVRTGLSDLRQWARSDGKGLRPFLVCIDSAFHDISQVVFLLLREAPQP